MGKRIIFCADGTWDSASKQTNVYKFYSALLHTADQNPIYGDGVGVEGIPLIMLLGGAFGTGLWQKIKDGYTQIAHSYKPGDELYIVGFSRGAYTARSLAGMITICGLPTANLENNVVELAFDAYRDKDNRAAKLQKLASWKMDSPDIKMVGVWDTVGALGIPSVFGAVDPVLYGFLDTTLNPKIKNALQAVAIDERRKEFMPTLWTGAVAPGQVVEQVWFTGSHSDVGGGEPDATSGAPELSDITLSWMIEKARALGLTFDESVVRRYAHPMDSNYALSKFHESWSILWGVPHRRQVPGKASIANSVAVRCQVDSEWRPANLTFVSNVLASDYEIVRVVNQPAASAASAGPTV